MIKVFEAPDELAAITLREMLEEEGIPVFVQSYQVPWYDGIMRVAKGFWGRLLVRDEDAERAKEIVEDFVRMQGRETPEELS